MASDKRPVKEIKIGSVKAAIWENETESGRRFNITAQRLYKDDKGWKSSESFNREDIPLLIKVLDRAHSYCYESGSEQSR